MNGTVTIVTSLFDLSKREGNPRRKSLDHYLRLAEIWLRTFEPLADKVIVFCDPELADRLPHAVPLILEETEAWSWLPAIRGARETNPFVRLNEVKDTPLYGAFQRAKIGLLKQASRICGTSHIAWIDLGIAEAVPLDGAKEAIEHVRTLSKVQLMTHRKPQRIEDWRTIHQNVSGGFISGECGAVEEFCQLVQAYYEGILHTGFAPHDETLFEHVAAVNPEDFQNRRISSHQEIFRTFRKRARICLNMIVKDEAAIIERCLASVAPWIDRYAILDTGSTDGTPAIIERFMTERGISGLTYDGKFEDFSQARNDALDRARLQCDLGDGCDWILLCDADMKLVVDEPEFRERIFSQTEGIGVNALLVRQEAGLSYDNVRLVRRDAEARYVGSTHEFLSVNGVAKLVGVRFFDHADGSSRKEKFERDERLLLKELEEKPGDPRTLFYLAQTYKDLGRWTDSRYRYEQREKAGGWEEETWYSVYMQAFCLSKICRDRTGISQDAADLYEAELIAMVLKAYERRPWRAEPLLLLSTYLRETGRNELACAFAKIGALISYPKQDSLFIEDVAYRHGFAFELSVAGYYSKLPEVREGARRTCFALTLDRTAPCWAYDTARRNSVHYARTAKECFGAKRLELPFEGNLTEPYVAMNPSIYEHEGEIWRVVRTVNYRIEDDGRYTIKDEGNVIRTENLLVRPYGNFKVLPIVDSVESSKGRTDFVVQGYEDLRLFRWRDGWWATCTVRDRSPDGRAQIALLELNVKSDHVVVERCVVQEYGAEQHQKNWTPILPWKVPSDEEELRFLYAYESGTILKVDPSDLQAKVEIEQTERPVQNLRAVKGGSQLVPFTLNPGRHERDGYLAVVHESIDGHGKRIYLHRLVWMSSDLQVRLVSDPFVFDHVGIEFAPGLAVVGDKVVISYGYEDREARYVEAPIRSVEGFLKGG